MKPVPSKLLKQLLLLSAITVSQAAVAADDEITDPIAHGKQEHSIHCVKCHSDSVYTRANRKVRTLDALGKQVNMCKEQLGITWFDSDTEAVVQFLNKKYYRF